MPREPGERVNYQPDPVLERKRAELARNADHYERMAEHARTSGDTRAAETRSTAAKMYRAAYMELGKGRKDAADEAAACADAVGSIADSVEGLHRRLDAYCARRADAVAEQPARDIRADDHRVVGGVKLDAAIEPGQIFTLKTPKPLPSGKSVKIRVRVTRVLQDGRVETKGVTPGLYQGGYYTVPASELE